MNPDMNQPIPPPDSTREPEQPLAINKVDSEDRDSVAAYYQFEIDRGFSRVPEGSSFESMVSYRQQQLRDNKIAVAIGRMGDKVAATSVVALEDGTMGKKLAEDEAWAAGTVVNPERRGQGIGAQMSEQQDSIAVNAGKRFLLTEIDYDNDPSMRLRMNKAGYVLEEVKDAPEGKKQEKAVYRYRKDLRKNREQEGEHGINWVAEVASGKVQPAVEPINEQTPDRILIDPGNRDLVQEVVGKGYRGVFLIRPEDSPDDQLIEKNAIVFVRETAKTGQ